MSNDQIITITALTKYIKRTFDNDQQLQNIWIRGEISNFKKHSRGHMYFTIKDEGSKIAAVMFAGNNRFLKFIPENGMNILVRGYVSVYEATGQYQLYVNEMQLDGIGNLYQAYEQLKTKLASLGYFDDHNKKPLPKLPLQIGVVTSPTGAAIRDIVTTLKRRFPLASISLFPVLVQGPDAPRSIAKAINYANVRDDIDVLIVGRGGGSIEELWAFNEEIVAEAIYRSEIPIISAVGHETDITIADFVSDVRAATPTAAAEIAVPSKAELLERIDERKNRIQRAMREQLLTNCKKLTHLQKSYAFRYPRQLILQKEQQLDRMIEGINRNTARLIEKKKLSFGQLQRDLWRNHPEALISKKKEKLAANEVLLKAHLLAVKKEKQHSFEQLVIKLEALSPLKIMSRGYSLAYNKDETLIKSVSQVNSGDPLKVKLKDGIINCHIGEIERNEG